MLSRPELIKSAKDAWMIKALSTDVSLTEDQIVEVIVDEVLDYLTDFERK